MIKHTVVQLCELFSFCEILPKYMKEMCQINQTKLQDFVKVLKIFTINEGLLVSSYRSVISAHVPAAR